MLMKGPIHKKTLKNKILMWIYRNWPRVDQWAIGACDKYPCETCIHFDDWGCLRIGWMSEKCLYEPMTVVDEEGYING
uniref:Uncharacterized protein n=2 Tax=viral metagenome TaxID=1070528 RepID=A0A6M3X5W5_9ZZZZ